VKRNKILLWSIIVSLAGFLFGFDTVVISGADLSLQQLWPKGEFYHGFVIMASALWGTVIGAVFGAYPTDGIGRRKTLIVIGVLFLISAIGSSIAQSPEIFALFRFLGGLGIGASTIAAPAFISEVAPENDRGKLVAMYQFNIVFGILMAMLSNYLLQNIGTDPWRWMLGVMAIPSIIYLALVFFIPESPRWLITHKGDNEAATKILQTIYNKNDVSQELRSISADNASANKQDSIFSTKYRFPLILAFLLAMFNQFSGINAFLYYAPRIFEIAGLEKSGALLSSVGVGVVNLIFTLIGLSLIDKWGRRQLMYIGSIGYIVSLSLVALAFYLKWQGIAIPLFLFLFIASHAIGQGAVIWVFISEIFPNHLRANGQAFGSSVHWVLAAIIPSLVPVLFNTIGPAIVFAIFALFMVFQLVFVIKIMPETKGVSLEDLDKQLSNSKIW
jgi:MFS transporter, SP family, arabinose:H+ symporter